MSDRGPLAMLFLGLVGAYVALGWIADLSIGSSGVTLAWPSAGVAFGAMLYFGSRWWLLPAISIIVMHLTISTVPAAFLPWSVASNVCGALAGVYFVRRRQPDAIKRFDVSVGTSVLLGGIVLSFVSAAIGVAGLYLSDMAALNTVASGILRWAIGDLLGVIVITPVTLLYLQYHFRKPVEAATQSTHDASITEQRLWVGVLALTFLLSLWLRSAQPSYALAVISLPLAALIWGAVRLPPAPVVIANAVVWMVAVAAISQGFVGPRPDSTADATSIVAFLSVLAAIPITLSLGTQQSRQSAARLLHRANTDALT
ncbi:MAG: MASE1 domain-containing protein, partial [Xanthomonadales bacterium]|nr:MASE1 domain-containing protein [Xanthomonadales bacterium]